MYYLMYYSSKHSLWRNPRRIYKPVVKSTISKYFQFEKNSTDSAGDQEKRNYHDSRFGGDPEKSCSLCQDLRNFKYSSRTQFLDLELDWGLYIQCQDTARPTRTFLVAITASRTLCGGTFTSRSIIDMCSRDISNPHTIENVTFSVRIRHAVNMIDRADPSGRELSRRTTKSVHKWFRRTESRSRWFFDIIRGSNFIFLKPIHGYSLGIMMFLYDPNGQVLTRRGRRIHSDRSLGSTTEIINLFR